VSGDIRAAHIPYRKLGYFPYFVGYCAAKPAWVREMKRLKVDPIEFPPRGMTTVGMKDKDGYHLSIVAVNLPLYRRRPTYERYAAAAHEATHVASNMMELIGESRPSEEFFAYTVEDVTGWLIQQLSQRVKW
jgi:hypothetical protein